MEIMKIKKNKRTIVLTKQAKSKVKGGGLSGGGAVLPD